MIKSINELNLGFSDAQNYTQRGNKQMLSEVFVKNSYLDKLLRPSTYYLIGEKGTGKTAYAVFLSNNEYENHKASLKYIEGTDYEKFYELKKRNHFDISGYVDIWKTIILLLLAKTVQDNERIVSIFRYNQLKELMEVVDEYYNRAFSPEIVNVLKIIDKSDFAAKLRSKNIEIGGSSGNVSEFNEQKLQMNLLYICKNFSDCLKSLKLNKNLTLFIDGIDIRPNHIPYEDYLQCIKGLATASWSLNTELFSNIRDSKGQFKVVLLLRPDIFNSLNLQNATNKLIDNAVFLDWRTTYTEYKISNLYKMANKLLLYSQEEKISDIWEQYFDWRIPSSNSDRRENDTAFTEFLKISLSRPRDIQRILALIKELMQDRNMADTCKFSFDVYDSNQFQNQYSEYFLSSLKDQLSFYYSEDDFKHFRKFFDLFDRPRFTYGEYIDIYNKYVDYILEYAQDIPKFVEDPKSFLQLLYDSNVICAIEENGLYVHFSYREKSLSNISPEVPYGADIEYKFHYGLYKKVKMGRYS